jgi:recombination protein RecA
MIVVLTNEVRSGAFTTNILKRGSHDISAGATTIHYLASVRIRLEIAEHLSLDNKPSGIRVRATVLKNRWSVGLVPADSTEFDILFSEGVDRYAEVLDAAVTLGLVTVHANRYSGSGFEAHGRQGMLDILRTSSHAWDQLRDRVHSKCLEHAKL